ncbi:hypothetical protein AAG570_012444 [Ranatra chinensis]|uniref:Uncharacterized protein n=1 Tax=Ranatra chinensis TaxID=642074 RepID=A0ABD0YFS8_9HEMI
MGTVDRTSAEEAGQHLQIKTNSHKNKFEKLYKRELKVTMNSKKVINVTQRVPDQPTEEALKKGFNFAIAPRKISVEEIICGIEISQNVSVLVRNGKRPATNISKIELEALKRLRDDPEMAILPADKGNASFGKHQVYQSRHPPLFRCPRNPAGKLTLGHCVNRKPTHTHRYLNAASHHNPAQKKKWMW